MITVQPPDRVEEMVPVDSQCVFTDGQVIFLEGQLSDFAYLVVSGQVKLTKAHRDGDLHLATIGAGELFGEMGVLDGAVRSAKATALGETVLQAFDRQQLFALLQERPNMAANLMQSLSRRLRHADSLIGSPELARAHRPASLRARLRGLLRPGPASLDRLKVEFMPDALAIEERAFPFAAKAILYAIVGLVLSGVLWASLAKVDRIVTANGKVVTTDSRIFLQPRETSIIRAVAVQTGQVVEKDQVLVSLDPTFAGADERSVRAQMRSAAAEISRLELELRLAARDGVPGAAAEEVAEAPPAFSDQPEEQATQAELFSRWSAARNSAIRAARAEVGELDSHLLTLETQKVRLAPVVTASQKLEEVRRQSLAGGTGSLVNLLEAQHQRAADERDLAHIVSDMVETRNRIETVRARLAATLGGSLEKTAQELLTAKRDHARAAEQIKKQERLSALVEMRAPARAMVITLGPHSVGSVVREGETIATLVPLDVPLEIDLALDPKDISHLRVQDAVRIKLDAFPYQKYGTLDGVLQSINGDVVEEDAGGGRKTSVYKAHVTVTGNHLHDVPADFSLLPGMAANCEIKVGSRRLISYFLYPIIRTLDSGLREP